jgi:hypothetical protein
MSAESKPPSPLTFAWAKPRGQSRGLFFWLVVVFLGLAGFFYLFQVVYPQSQRFTPVPYQILLLDSGDTTARSVLSRAQDKDFLVLPPSLEKQETTLLQSKLPVFTPSYSKHEMELRDLPHKNFKAPPARLLRVTEPVLPLLDLSELKSEVVQPAGDEVAVPRLKVRLTGEVGQRALLKGPDLGNIAAADVGECRFQIGLDERGWVQFLLPLKNAETPELTLKIADRLKQMRFASAAEGQVAPAFGMAILEWHNLP